jgi:hypothetical protein
MVNALLAVAATATLLTVCPVPQDPASTPDAGTPGPDAPARAQPEGIARHSFRWVQTSDGAWAMIASIDPAPGWHVYWENPGDSGDAPRFELELPQGWRAGKTVYPRPDVSILDGSVFYGYSRKATYVVPVLRTDALSDDPWSRGNGAERGTWKVRARVMACKERCTVANLAGEGDWPPIADDGAVLTLNGGSIGGRSLPMTAAAGGIFARLEAGKVTIEGPARGAATVRFVPANVPGMQLSLADGSPAIDGIVTGERFRIDFQASSLGEGPGEPAVAGLILLGNDPAGPCVWLTIPHPLAGPQGSLGANGVGASDDAPPTK